MELEKSLVHSTDEIRNELLNLYLRLELRDEEGLSKYHKNSFKYEKDKLHDMDIMILIGYIRDSIEMLINSKGNDSKTNLSIVSDKSPSKIQKGYNEMLQNLESEVRMHIRVKLLYKID